MNDLPAHPFPASDPERDRRSLLGEGLLGISQRIPPASLAAEQALLGALLANNKAYERVSDYLLPEHFADPIHARIFKAIRERINEGQLADAVTLRTQFENGGVLDEVGGPGYLAQLLSAMVGIINAGEYGRLIHDCWLRREMIDVGETLVNRSFGVDYGETDEPPSREIAIAVASTLLDLAQQRPGRSIDLGSVMDEVLEEACEAFAAGGRVVRGIPCGIPGLDDLLGLLQAQQMIVIGGRPGMGKSVIGLNACKHAAKLGHHSAFFSLEMSGKEIGLRMLADETKIPMDRIKRGRLSQAEFDRLYEAKKFIASLPLVIDETPGISVAELRLRCRSIGRRRPLELVAIDYLGLIRPPQELARHGPVAGLEHNSNRVKELAKELNAPVIALHQLNRGVESREDKRPMLSDLRWSGAIEQDADVVIFEYRDEYYRSAVIAQRPDEPDFKFHERQAAQEEALERCRGRIEHIVAKQRQGPCMTIHGRFDGATASMWQDDDQLPKAWAA